MCIHNRIVHNKICQYKICGTHLDDPLGVLQDEVNVLPSKVLEVADGGPHIRQGTHWTLAELLQHLEGCMKRYQETRMYSYKK